LSSNSIDLSYERNIISLPDAKTSKIEWDTRNVVMKRGAVAVNHKTVASTLFSTFTG